MEIEKLDVRLSENKVPYLLHDSAVDYSNNLVVNNPQKVVDMMNEIYHLRNLPEEHVYLISLNTKCRVVGIFEISHGSINAACMNSREIFIRLLLSGAASFILVHNHPSGDPTPSREDYSATTRLENCGTMLGVELLDHLIVGDTWISLKNREE